MLAKKKKEIKRIFKCWKQIVLSDSKAETKELYAYSLTLGTVLKGWMELATQMFVNEQNSKYTNNFKSRRMSLVEDIRLVNVS